ncbi:MAG: ABC transporter permease [Crocinitomicaceae bacterium]|nr:ABC transporter permease [Crocinitomicaceae bacterium]
MIFTIFKKELIDTLRDRRTLMAMVIIPLVIFPLIMTVFTSISKSYSKDLAEKTLKVGVLEGQDNNEILAFLDTLQTSGKIELIAYEDSNKLKSEIKENTIHFGVIFPEDFNSSLNGNQTGKVKIFHNSTKLGYKEQLEMILEMKTKALEESRLKKLNITKENINPVELEFQDVASDKEKIGKIAGGILPYFFIIFCFIGCMYPAIDLFTGEKERGTIETILTVPVTRVQLLIGKMGVVVCSGLLAATLSLLGLFLTLNMGTVIEDPKLMEVITGILSPKFILTLYLLLIPLTIFFAGIMIPIAVYAKSFKEAQSIITPLNMIVILPAMVGFFPGIELNLTTSFIPVVNIVLSTKEIIAGTINYGYLGIVFLSSLILAGIAIFFSHKQYSKETNVVI